MTQQTNPSKIKQSYSLLKPILYVVVIMYIVAHISIGVGLIMELIR